MKALSRKLKNIVMTSKVNLTGDTELFSVIDELSNALRGVDADTLRESDATRHSVKESVDDILSRFAPRG